MLNTKKQKITKLIAAAAAMLLIAHLPTAVLAEKKTETPNQTTLIAYSAPNPDTVDWSKGNGSEQSGKIWYSLANDMYSVRVRPQGAEDSEWQELSVYKARVLNMNTRDAAFVYFDCDGPVEVEVNCKNIENVESAGALNDTTKIYPASYNIQPQYEQNSKVMTFTAQPNQRIVVDPNGDTRHSLHVFANKVLELPSEKDLENKSVTYINDGDALQAQYDTDVVYVKSGFYNSNFSVKSNQTWYIEGGAVIRGCANLDNAKNAKLIGHGVFYRPDGRALSIDNSSDVYIEGVIVCNYGAMSWGGCLASVGNSKNITIKNVKSIACNQWSDAVDIFTSEDVTIEDCFFRSGDDCIAVYGPRWNGKFWGDTGNVRNINVSGCVLMPDRARPIHFGTHGDGTSPNGGRILDNASFRNIDILTYNTYAVDNSGNALPQLILLKACDGNKITNVYFENIRIQDAIVNKYLDMYMATSAYGTNSIAGRGIENIYFKDIYYTNPNEGAAYAYISGYSASQVTRNVTFENLQINGKVIESAEEGNANIGSNTQNIKFVKSGGAYYIYNSAIVPEDIWPKYYDYAQCSGVSVTAPYSEKGSEPKLAIDGNESTVWYSNTGSGEPNNAYTNGETLEGITIDLGTVRRLRCIRITWENTNGYKYRIFTSKDGVDWGAKDDEQQVGSLNPKADADYKRVKWNWLANQRYPVEGRYVKIVPCDGYQLAISEIAILGDDMP